MAVGGVLLGSGAKAYRNDGGTFGTPVWSEINAISDLTVNQKWEEADASVRASKVKLIARTLVDLNISGKIRSSLSGDTNYLALYDSFLGSTPVDLMFLNSAHTVNGARGWRCLWFVFDASQDQSLSAALFDQIMFRPAVDATATVQSVVVTANVPVFTTF